MQQVHKEQLNYVENALPNRSSVDIEIFGVEGIPEDVLATHKQRVIQQFYEAEENRRVTTGNPAPGTVSGNAPKKSKLETPEEMKKRLEEHVKKRLSDKEAGVVNTPSGTTTPNGGPVQAPGSGYVSHANSIIQSNWKLTFFKGQFSQPPASFPGQTGPPQAYPQALGQPPFQQPPYPQAGFVPPGQFPPGQQPPFPQQFPPNAGAYPPQAASHGLPQRPSFNGPPGAPPNTANAIDELISSVKMEMDANKTVPEFEADPILKAKPDGTAETKPSKSKSKSRPVKFMYMSELSPEERMADLPQYAFSG